MRERERERGERERERERERETEVKGYWLNQKESEIERVRQRSLAPPHVKCWYHRSTGPP